MRKSGLYILGFLVFSWMGNLAMGESGTTSKDRSRSIDSKSDSSGSKSGAGYGNSNSQLNDKKTDLGSPATKKDSSGMGSSVGSGPDSTSGSTGTGTGTKGTGTGSSGTGTGSSGTGTGSSGTGTGSSGTGIGSSGMGSGTGTTGTGTGSSGMGSSTESSAATGGQIEDSDIMVLSFSSNSSQLSSSDMQSIKGFVDQEKNAGEKIDKFIVAAWSDRDFDNTTQSKDEKKLAKSRSTAVSKALKDGGANSITSYEMTDSPTWISRAFNTSDAEYKGSTSSNDQTANEISQKLHTKGGAGKVLIVAKHKMP